MIAKPYRSEDLAARVRTVLGTRRRLGTVAPVPGRAAAVRTEAGRRVLFVEDEVVLRMSTVDMLERLGCMVSAVCSAEQALELLDRGDRFGLLLTDLGLPGMSGEELAAEVQRRLPLVGQPAFHAERMHPSRVQPQLRLHALAQSRGGQHTARRSRRPSSSGCR